VCTILFGKKISQKRGTTLTLKMVDTDLWSALKRRDVKAVIAAVAETPHDVNKAGSEDPTLLPVDYLLKNCGSNPIAGFDLGTTIFAGTSWLFDVFKVRGVKCVHFFSINVCC